MAKAKGSKGATHKHLRSRIKFLHQASAYLLSSSGDRREDSANKDPQDPALDESREACTHGIDTPGSMNSRRLLSHLRAVSLKSQIRLNPEVKHSICKRCNIHLIEGQTCVKSVENSSKGENKPWADVLVVECKSCGTKKRFPSGAKREKQRRHTSVGQPEVKNAKIEAQ